MTKITNLTQAVTKSPLLWGILGSAAFYSLVHSSPLGTPFIKRYFTSHPVEYAETVMFTIGLAALLLKLFDVWGQSAGLRQSPLGAAARPGDSIATQCQDLLKRIATLPGGYYADRLRAAIQFVWRHESAAELDDRLLYLADVDATRSHADFGLFRVIVWAIPIMGFLGTVIGITMALNGIDKNHLDDSMQHVLAGLGLKFDTTALALAMAMALMFIHFFVDRAANLLLAAVDGKVEEDLTGRFVSLPAGADGQLAAIRRMAETMIQMTERLVGRQAELWQASMEAASARWTHTADGAAEVLKRGLVEALGESLKQHAQQLAVGEQAAAEQNRRHWNQVQQTQVQNVQAITALQSGVTRQAEVLGRAIEVSGEIGRLEQTLNRNLAALAGAKNFEQTVLGLAAAIHLLNARFSETPADKPAIHLEPGRRAAHAA